MQELTEHLKNLKQTVSKMDPIEQACAATLTNLAANICDLLNQRNFDMIAEMQAVILNMFEQTEQIKKTTEVMQ